MKEGGFDKVEILSRDVMIVQRDMEALVVGLDLHLRDVVGEEWSGEEKEKIKGTIETMLASRRKEFVVDLEGGKMGLRMNA